MRFTVLGANISAATIAMQEARKMHAQAHEKLNFTMRYIETAEAEQKIDVADAIRKLREAERSRDEAKAVMDRFLTELGYGY
mgnify:CR=1 FL=1